MGKIAILGVTLTFDLEGMGENIYTKYEAIEKMLKHWSYRTLNIHGRMTIIKLQALSKLGHLAIVLPNLDNQKANKLEKVTLDFIWKKFSDSNKNLDRQEWKKHAKKNPAY